MIIKKGCVKQPFLVAYTCILIFNSMRIKSLLILLLFFRQAHAQIETEAYLIDSLVQSQLTPGNSMIGVDTMGLLLEANKQGHLYFFLNKNDKTINAIKEERSADEQITYFFHKNELIRVDVKRKDSLPKSFYFIDENTYVKEGNAFKENTGTLLQTIATNYRELYLRKNQ